MRYVYLVMQAYPNMNYRYIVKPTMSLPGGYIPLDFGHKGVLEDLTKWIHRPRAVLMTARSTGNAHDVVNTWLASQCRGLK
jgi:hypothetical protein